jgi:hypothetical protein
LAHLTALSLSPPELVDAALRPGTATSPAADASDGAGTALSTCDGSELDADHEVRLAATGIEVLDIELARIGRTSG